MVGKIKLIKQEYETDNIGQQIITETYDEIIANIDTPNRSEFFQAGQIGLRASMVFTIWGCEYNGADILIYNDVTYTIYRTYANKGGKIELYCEKRVGNE